MRKGCDEHERRGILQILKNIYSTLNYDDWFHAKEYVRLEIEKLEKNLKNNELNEPK